MILQNKKHILSIHQPNYIPWIGYFSKIIQSDYFVILDSVQYPRGKSYAARNQIKTSNGTTMLTIPLSIPKGKDGKVKYTDIKFVDEKWKTKHLRTIEMNYKKASYFGEVFPEFTKLINSATDFTEMNIAIILMVTRYLRIETNIVRLSDILQDFGQKTQLIIDICKSLDVDIYLSGTGGGKDYNEENLLNENGIELRYSEFRHPVYPQLWGKFETHLSILDLLFNMGRKSINYIKL